MKLYQKSLWSGLTSLAVLLLAVLACGGEPAPPIVPAPVLSPLPTRTPPPAASATPLTIERFDTGTEGWQTWAQEGAISEMEWDPVGQLLWLVESAPERIAGLVWEWNALAGADGLTLRLTSLDRSAFLFLSMQEADGTPKPALAAWQEQAKLNSEG